ncbi:hypothetical protein BDV25DRAFT_6718 [Aspergillus avenaceus]|uniref:Uncharacterized protein n=1 Tax=Aspergillus avenaceus TaxID=36643 RepID=A0A5N6TS34_ASPAV|nr:hypothetical protein BDV25DRAFT_6718 [Aspergillus avenaceus]
MPFWKKRSRWPPLPTVEEELESLSRELYGLTQIGEKPGIEGVCARGTIDQHPVIIDVITISSIVQVDTQGDLGPGKLFFDDSRRPPTPPADSNQPYDFHSGIAQQKGYQFRPTPLFTPPASRDTSPQGQSRMHAPQLGRNSKPTTGLQRPSRPSETRAQSTTPQKAETLEPHKVPSISKIPVATKSPSSLRHAPTRKTSVPLPSTPKQSEGIKPENPVGRSATGLRKPTPIFVHQSNLPTPKSKGHHDGLKPKPLGQGMETPPLTPPRTPSLAERLEEKLRLRHEKRVPATAQDARKNQESKIPIVIKSKEPAHAENKANPPASIESKTKASTVALKTKLPVPSEPKAKASTIEVKHKLPAPAEPKVKAVSIPQEPAIQVCRPQLAPIVTNVDPPSFKNEPLPTTFIDVPIPRLVPPDEAQSAPLPPKRIVSFRNEALKPAIWKHMEDAIGHLQSRRVSPPPGAVRPPSPSRPGQCLLPCPRSVPVAGYQDWYTIKGMAHLDICPSCLKQMRKSKFRDLFIDVPRARSEKIRCSMSEPWTRLAWVQTVKKQLDHMHLLCQITQPPLGTQPCTGRVTSKQNWYRVVDPSTGMFLPKFNACSACVRNLRILMPPHQDTFKHGSAVQEAICDFVTDSPRFVRYIDHLDLAANRAEHDHSPQPDLSDFMAYARRKVVLRDCRRDRVALNTWYYMPNLPDFTVCEDCYDDAVWPLVRANYPIARKFSSMMRLPPGEGPTRCREASCQLYSPRMRLKFREAVEENDLTYLNKIALRRYVAEQRYRKHQVQLLDDEDRGYNCDAELGRNLEEWKRWE